jgi:hypothetical protein
VRGAAAAAEGGPGSGVAQMPVRVDAQPSLGPTGGSPRGQLQCQDCLGELPGGEGAVTVAQIQKRQDRLARKFEVAKQIRKLLDDLKKEIGSDYDDDEWEVQILDLVTEEA